MAGQGRYQVSYHQIDKPKPGGDPAVYNDTHAAGSMRIRPPGRSPLLLSGSSSMGEDQLMPLRRRMSIGAHAAIKQRKADLVTHGHRQPARRACAIATAVLCELRA